MYQSSFPIPNYYEQNMKNVYVSIRLNIFLILMLISDYFSVRENHINGIFCNLIISKTYLKITSAVLQISHFHKNLIPSYIIYRIYRL